MRLDAKITEAFVEQFIFQKGGKEMRKWLNNFMPYEIAYGSLLDMIQYFTERRWNAKFWRRIGR